MPLTREELDEFLAGRRLAHFATVAPGGPPRVRPIWYLWADGAFWFTTRLEARHTGTDVAAGSQVAVSVASDERPYRAVLARGRPEVWTRDRRSWLERISTRYGVPEGRRWLAGALKEPDRVVLRMAPDELLSWHYGRGDYTKQNAGKSMRTPL